MHKDLYVGLTDLMVSLEKICTKNIYVTCLVEKLLLTDPIQREWSKNNNTDLQF